MIYEESMIFWQVVGLTVYMQIFILAGKLPFGVLATPALVISSKFLSKVLVTLSPNPFSKDKLRSWTIGWFSVKSLTLLVAKFPQIIPQVDQTRLDIE